MIKKIGGWGNFVLLLLFIGLAIFFLYQKYSLRQNSKYIEGIVLGKSKGAKGNIHLDYQFKLNGYEYKGFIPVSYCKECEVGDTVIVRYESDNPENNDLVKQLPNGEALEQ